MPPWDDRGRQAPQQATLQSESAGESLRLHFCQRIYSPAGIATLLRHSTADFTSPWNNGCGRFGRDLNSG